MIGNDSIVTAWPKPGLSGSSLDVQVHGLNVPATVSGSARSGAGTWTGMAQDHLDRIHSERGPAGGVRPDEGRPRLTAYRRVSNHGDPHWRIARCRS